MLRKGVDRWDFRTGGGGGGPGIKEELWVNKCCGAGGEEVKDIIDCQIIKLTDKEEGETQGFSEQKWVAGQAKLGGGGVGEKNIHVRDMRSGLHSQPEEGRMDGRSRNFFYQVEEMKRGQLRPERGSEGN